MAITVTGLGSGLNYDDWITQLVAVKQAKIDAVSKQVKTIQSKESTLSQAKSYYSDLQTAIKTLTDTLNSNSVFKQKAVTSSSDAITAKVDSSATAQAFAISVDSLATATTAKSASAAAAYVNSDTKISAISEGAVKGGTFSVYVDGTKHNLTIDSNATLGSVVDNLNQIDGVNAKIEDGKLTIGSSGSSSVVVGSTSDTSNFSKVMSLSRDTDTGVYSSSKSLFSTDSSASLTGTSFAKGKVTAGTFTIGNAEFTIDSNTTLDSLITKINNNADAGVTAYWDSNSGKLSLTSNDEGAMNINISAGTSNFTDIMGLTTSTWKEDGSVDTSQLVANTQTLGTNAVLTINGTPITSSSNTVTSDISGIAGLTLTLNDKTTSTANINITNDTSAASKAITDFVSKYNLAISYSKDSTSSDGTLYGDSLLNMLSSTVRRTATGAVSFDNTYKSLASIGITTGAIGTDVKADVSQLKVDTDKLTEALEKDPDSVLKLFVGNNATQTNGVLTSMNTTLENSLNPVNGYFASSGKTYDKQVDRLNDKIDTMNTDLTKYKAQLEAKFQAMDTLISNLKNSSSVFDSYFNKNNSSSSSSSSSL